VQVLNEAQMLGIPLNRSSSSRARSNSHQLRRSSPSTSPVSHRSSPASSPAKPYTVTSSARAVRQQRGSSTPSRLDRDPTADIRRRDSKTRTANKFNIRNFLAKISAGRTSPTTTEHRQRHVIDVDGKHPPLTRRSLSQPEQQQRHGKRSLSASAPLRRARINDSTSSIGGASTISQYYPSAVAAAAAAAAQRLSPSPCHSARCHRASAAGTAVAVRAATSLRSSAGSVWTAHDSLPDSMSVNSLGSVFSLKSSSTGASPALWTPFSPHTGPFAHVSH